MSTDANTETVKDATQEPSTNRAGPFAKPLYEGAPADLSVFQGHLLLFQFSIRHSLTSKALQEGGRCLRGCFYRQVSFGRQPLAEFAANYTTRSGQDVDDEESTDALPPANEDTHMCENRELLAPDQYRAMVRGLNPKQKQVVAFHRRWCKDAVIAMRKGDPVRPYRVFLSGPGGVGKSHVISLVHNDTIKLLRLSGHMEPDDVAVLLTAPTGVAAFNIQGMTLHSALVLGTTNAGCHPLAQDKLNTLRTKLSNLQLLIIDEVSMVGSDMLLQIH